VYRRFHPAGRTPVHPAVHPVGTPRMPPATGTAEVEDAFVRGPVDRSTGRRPPGPEGDRCGMSRPARSARVALSMSRMVTRAGTG
jgi:hypothetical protein